MSSPFCEIVEHAFDFLERKHDFQIIERSRTAVVYESKAVRAVLFYDDQRSFEVSLGLSLKNNSSQPAFSFEEILRSLNVPPVEWPSGYAAQKLDIAGRIIKKMADIMSRYSVRLLQGDPDSWSLLAEQRWTDCIAYAATTNLTQAKRTADAAWAEKDFGKVVRVLAPLQEHLNPSDLKKLEYAKKHSEAST